jgi:hypothetical protein
MILAGERLVRFIMYRWRYNLPFCRRFKPTAKNGNQINYSSDWEQPFLLLQD